MSVTSQVFSSGLGSPPPCTTHWLFFSRLKWMWIGLLAANCIGINDCLRCRKRVIQMGCVHMGQTRQSCFPLGLVGGISLAAHHTALHKAVSPIPARASEVGWLASAKQANAFFCPIVEEDQIYSFVLLLGHKKKSISWQQQSCSVKCPLPWPPWSPEAEQIPFSAGTITDLLHPCPDPGSASPSFPSHLLCPALLRRHRAADQGKGERRQCCPPLPFFSALPPCLGSVLLAWLLSPRGAEADAGQGQGCEQRQVAVWYGAVELAWSLRSEQMGSRKSHFGTVAEPA